VTIFSLGTQALYLGLQGSTLACQLQISRLELILSVLPHAIPELTALFLPLAAWLIACRRDRGLCLAAHPPLALGRPLLARDLDAAAELAEIAARGASIRSLA
jgi:hypothetical protein